MYAFVCVRMEKLTCLWNEMLHGYLWWIVEIVTTVRIFPNDPFFSVRVFIDKFSNSHQSVDSFLGWMMPQITQMTWIAGEILNLRKNTASKCVENERIDVTRSTRRWDNFNWWTCDVVHLTLDVQGKMNMSAVLTCLFWLISMFVLAMLLRLYDRQ